MLSALEGLTIATPALQPYVLPAAVAILVVLFAVQPLGTARIGRAFGPIMAVWFLAIALLGISGHRRSIRRCCGALNPLYGLRYLFAAAARAFWCSAACFYA